MNSLIHGFEKTDSGIISIKLYITDSQLFIEYFDDGIGIAIENVKHVFKPLFTTKKDHGGSGLGMHIINGMVRQNLNGNIELVNDSAQGVHFRISIPV